MSQNDSKTPGGKTPAKKSQNGKPTQESKLQQFLARMKSIPLGIKKAVLNTVAELKKVTWPTRQDLINYSLVVLAFMVALGILVGVLDLGASGLVKLLVGA